MSDAPRTPGATGGPGERGAVGETCGPGEGDVDRHGGRAGEELAALTADLVQLGTVTGCTVAVAESLTAGLICARIADVPGASAVLRGGVVVYATDLKARLLGVDAELLGRAGPVHAEVARQLADGVRRRLSADFGVSTTGVAGPGPADGHPAGTVHIAVAWAGGGAHDELALTGTRAEIRLGSATAAVRLLLHWLMEQNPDALR